MKNSDVLALIKSKILSEKLIKLIFSGSVVPSSSPRPWIKVSVHPVSIKDKLYLQFNYYDKKKGITKNLIPSEALDEIEMVYGMHFKDTNIHMLEETVHLFASGVNTMKVRSIPSERKEVRSLTHDRIKKYLLGHKAFQPFLKEFGIVGADGIVRAQMKKKYEQINEFVKLLSQTYHRTAKTHCQLNIVDFGCGNAYLTFATCIYFNDVMEISAQVVGVDVQQEPITRNSSIAKKLKLQNISFECSNISEFPVSDFDITIALHACDIASDMAIAYGIKCNSDIILVAPCCHHNIQIQLKKAALPTFLAPVMDNGILKERFGDIVTDTLRYLFLQSRGYKTDIVQFVGLEHSAKNLLIRAYKGATVDMSEYARKYKQLADVFHLRPYLSELFKL